MADRESGKIVLAETAIQFHARRMMSYSPLHRPSSGICVFRGSWFGSLEKYEAEEPRGVFFSSLPLVAMETSTFNCAFQTALPTHIHTRQT